MRVCVGWDAWRPRCTLSAPVGRLASMARPLLADRPTDRVCLSAREDAEYGDVRPIINLRRRMRRT